MKTKFNFITIEFQSFFKYILAIDGSIGLFACVEGI